MLTLQYIPFREHEELDSDKKIKKLLNIVKEDKIVLMEGRLSPHEEAELIERTMEQIDRRFKGIEIATVNPNNGRSEEFYKRLKNVFFNLILGKRLGITIIGPASIVKEIKRNPNKIELLTKSKYRR